VEDFRGIGAQHQQPDGGDFCHVLTQVTGSCQDDGEGVLFQHMVREMAETASGVALWRLAVDRRTPRLKQ